MNNLLEGLKNRMKSDVTFTNVRVNKQKKEISYNYKGVSRFRIQFYSRNGHLGADIWYYISGQFTTKRKTRNRAMNLVTHMTFASTSNALNLVNYARPCDNYIKQHNLI